jgi:AcrR family transcriptional regulator
MTTTNQNHDYHTIARLIEAAGIVFGEKGYDRTMVKDIADQAQVSPSAVNYHFKGKDNLYYQALNKAVHELFIMPDINAIVTQACLPEEKLKQILALHILALLTTSPDSWSIKLIFREMAMPTQISYDLLGKEVKPLIMTLRQVVAQIMNLPEDHLTVTHGLLFILSQIPFIFQHKSALEAMTPDLKITPDWITGYVENISTACIAGLHAMAKSIANTQKPISKASARKTPN